MGLKGQQISIIGAGIGGLSAALALAQRGADVTVLEQAGEITEVGAGIQISPNGFAVLRALGLGPAFEAASVRADAVVLREGGSGRQVFRLDLTRGSRAGARRYAFVHRADIIDLLADAVRAAGVRIRLLQQVSGVYLDTAPEGRRPRLSTAQGAQMSAALLLGAEGLQSRVRRALNGSAVPVFTGQVAWRALVPLAHAAPAQASVYMGAGRHLVAYPLRDRRLMNIVAVEERHSWTAEGWTQPDDPDNLRRAFGGFGPEVRALLQDIGQVHLWGLFRHPVAARWHQGHAAILGDAAHPTLPFLAQGANMALEDSWVLADALERADNVEAGLASYQARRRARVVRVVAAASRNARNYHLHASPLRFAAHTALRLGSALAPDLALRKFDWLYGHDVTARPRRG